MTDYDHWNDRWRYTRLLFRDTLRSARSRHKTYRGWKGPDTPSTLHMWWSRFWVILAGVMVYYGESKGIWVGLFTWHFYLSVVLPIRGAIQDWRRAKTRKARVEAHIARIMRIGEEGHGDLGRSRPV